MSSREVPHLRRSSPKFPDDDESADDEIGPLRPVERRSTLPATSATALPSAMRQPAGVASEPGVRTRKVELPLENPHPSKIDSDGSDEHYHEYPPNHIRSGPRYGGSSADEPAYYASSRHSRRARPSGPQYLLSSSSSESEDSDHDLYNFTPSYAASSEPAQSIASVDSSTPFLTTNGASHSQAAKTMHVYQAEYTGDSCREGNHASRLTLLHNPKHPQQALFRWIHVEQSVMNFDAFWDQIARITNLTSPEKSAIKKMMQDVKNRGIQRVSTAQGGHKVMQTKNVQHVRWIPPDDSETSTSKYRGVYWMNLPYFELKKYSTEKCSPELFPARPLMQVDYSHHLMARDMQQAVRQIKEGPEGHCFHIGQLWAVVVDNSLLVTCSTMSEKKLGNNKVEIKNPPPKEKSGESDEPRILVEYLGNVWAIPLRECLTWFAFTTHFWEFWPSNVQFYRSKKPVSPQDWPDIVESSRRGASRVLLEAVKKPLPRLPPRGVLAPNADAKPTPKQPDVDKINTNGADGAAKGNETVIPSNSISDHLSPESKRFSLFAWIQARPGISSTMAAKAELGHIDQFLRKRTRKSDQRAYNDCPEASCDDIRTHLHRLSLEKKMLEMDEGSNRAALQDRIDTFNAAVVVFTYFLPVEFVGPSTRRFWGSLKLLLDRPWVPPQTEARIDNEVLQSFSWTKRHREANANLPSARKALRRVARQVLLFQQIMSHAPGQDQAGIDIPTQLLQAYIYFVLAITQASLDPDLHRSHMRTFTTLLYGGMRSMMKSLSPPSLLTYASLVPGNVLSLISLGLLNDFTGTYSNIHSVYAQWIRALENEIETRPALSHQEKIQWLLAEINVIIGTLEQQSSTLTPIQSSSTAKNLLVTTSYAAGRSAAPGGSSALGSLFARGGRNATRLGSVAPVGSLAPGASSSAGRYYPAGGWDAPGSSYYENRPGDSYDATGSYAPGPAFSTVEGRRETDRTTRTSTHPRTHTPRHSRYESARYVDDEASVYSADRYGYDDDDQDDRSQLPALDPGGYSLLLADVCQHMVQQRLAEFRQFKGRALGLQQVNTHKAETRKDYHDQAVYAFTVVTVVFLPLSAVASIFGMNTADMRDLGQGQWLYWAVAVPVTAGVIFLGLWCMGELGNAAAWLLNLRHARQSQAAAAAVTAPPPGYGRPPGGGYFPYSYNTPVMPGYYGMQHYGPPPPPPPTEGSMNPFLPN